MSVKENIQSQSAVDGQSTFPMGLESIEHPGWMVTWHPKPDEYTMAEWSHMVSCLHTSKGRVVKAILSAHTFKDLGPYPLKSIVDQYGVEAIWH